MKIDLRFAAEELRLLRGVIENSQVLLEISRRSEGDEVGEGIVITADRSRHYSGFLAQADVDPAAGFVPEIRIADNELKGRVVRAAGEEFLRGRSALREGGVHGQLPVVEEMIDHAAGGAKRSKVLILLIGGRE